MKQTKVDEIVEKCIALFDVCEEEFVLRKAIRLTAKEIFINLEIGRTKEVRRLKKVDDANWKKGNKEDGRKSTACVLTMGINAKNLINKEKNKWLGEDEKE